MKWYRSKWFIILIAVIVCGSGTYVYLTKGKKSKAADVKEAIYEVKKGNIRSSVSGTAQFEPKDTQTISVPVDSDIKSINLKRNLAVKAGDVLLELTSTSLESDLQDAQLTYEQTQKDLDSLMAQQGLMAVKAPVSGKLTYATNLEEGATINKSTKIATISDVNNLTVTLPFFVEDAAQLHNGDPVDLTIDGYMITKTGKIQSISKDPKSDGKGGKVVDIDVAIPNDNSMDAGTSVLGSVTIGGRAVDSQAKAALQYVKVTTVLAGTTGNVATMPLKTGNMVRQGDLLATFANDTIGDDILTKQSALERAKLKVDSAQDKVDGLKILAPFDGVFSTDFVNKRNDILSLLQVGTKVTSGMQLGAVASIAKMQLPVQVDELDLPNVKLGMKAEIKVDAYPGRIFPAEVTQISSVGTTTNGVTAYDVVLAADNKDNVLKYGMTATGEILIQDKKDAIYIPPEALQLQKGKRIVTLKKADGTVEPDHEVKIGIRSKTQIEITEGLSEGDKVVLPTAVKRQQNLSQDEINRLRQQFQQNGGAGGAGGFGGGGAGGGFPGGGGGGAGGATRTNGGGGGGGGNR
ncbi:efflux RND transporter periplasmic adaptor subunit [Paenibacillus sp. CGMCC 1.16610]|uniref:Efflux RND transporter periplasmic adaptor subunit n=1 Tax=Paenibacillus anseongense TaxID=2682845 RepID=A0ABW9UIZ6_9BACL|nr:MULTISPECIES: efflux RND transporter periplasmic adaptor subunit [Paenibacillus]MBA2939991.1 efflux RND transporter periplasmic adaptor subunit [Paenibacillus sp. CGMCC 1.16610]MVQ38946.1 efflux RND transporter periplasmic adaptor subunit [Paenibacillus anseongense]